jgi:hypothetical protein
VTDWTVILTSVGTASITGAVAYFTAKRSGDVALRGVEAETERLRLQLAEPHFQHRQSVYHDFLDSAHRFHQAQSVEPFEPGEYQVWARRFEHDLSAVRLFGSEGASTAAQALADAIFGAIGRHRPGEALGELPRAARGSIATRLAA